MSYRKIDKEKMLQMYNDGYTYDEIAHYFGTKSGKNIEDLVRKEIKGVDKGKVKRLWLAGWGIYAIMKECHATEEEIREVVFRGKPTGENENG